MDLRLTVELPKDVDDLHSLRHALDGALERLDVAPQSRADVSLLITETWSNIIAHVQVGCSYKVETILDDQQCVIEVTDSGGTPDTSNALAASGRALQIVTALADSVEAGPDGLLRKVTKRL